MKANVTQGDSQHSADADEAVVDVLDDSDPAGTNRETLRRRKPSPPIPEVVGRWIAAATGTGWN